MARWNSFFQFLAEAQQSDEQRRQELVSELLRERRHWPWIEGRKATFIYTRFGVKQVALNLDIIEEDPPFAPMVNLPGTDFWYLQLEFEEDDLLDYLIAVDDPMTPLRGERDLVGRIGRHWHPDPFNPQQLRTDRKSVV